MNEVLHANIFFFITGVAVIAVATLICVGLFHGIKAVVSIRRILNRIEEGTEVIVEDMQNVREYFVQGGLLPRLIRKFFGGNNEKMTRETKQKRTAKGKSEL